MAKIVCEYHEGVKKNPQFKICRVVISKAQYICILLVGKEH